MKPDNPYHPEVDPNWHEWYYKLQEDSFSELFEKLAKPKFSGRMEIVYIAHQISGDVKGNIDAILRIIRMINMFEPHVVPFAPYIPDCLCMNDSIPEERERGIKNDIALINAGFIDTCRLYGPRISTGMKAEKELFGSLRIPVIDLTRPKK